MPLRFITLMVSPLILAASVVASFGARAVVAALDLLTELFPSPRAVFAMGAFDPLVPSTGHSVDPALQHSLRHEAGLFRRAAARKV